MYDLAIIGGGPAGLTAAVTGRVRGAAVLVCEGSGHSPYLRRAPEIVNYPALSTVTGSELVEKMLAQARSFAPDIVEHKVLSILPREEGFALATAGEVYSARTVILATGITHAQTLSGEQEYLGRGVSYCATCDGFLYRRKTIAIVSYIEQDRAEVEFLAKLCSKVHYFPLALATGNTYALANVATQREKITALRGKDKVTAVVTTAGELPVDGVFIFREAEPVELLLPGIKLTGRSIATDAMLATNIPGVFAAGDCRGGPYQIAKAVGEGQVAAFSALAYLDNVKKLKQRSES